jgi:hypothetical protein
MATKGYALHIGVNKTDPSHYPGLQQLKCCLNDAREFENISSALKFDKVETLFNEKATTDAYHNLLEQWRGELQEGDLLWITYSGHGGTKPDTNKDEERKYDVWDETWCMYDRELLDDEQYLVYSKFNDGVRILIFSDSCHSGTVAKAIRMNDTLPADLTSETWQDFKLNNNARSRMASPEGCINRYFMHQKMYDDLQTKNKKNETTMGAYVVQFGACRDEQECIEFGGHGYFTSVMLNLLRSPKNLSTYQSLYEAVAKADIKGHQDADLYTYGNEKYSFLNDFPLSVTGAPLGEIISQKRSAAISQDDADLIVHHKAAARSNGNAREEELRSLTTETPGGHTAWDRAYKLYMQKRTNGESVFVEPNLRSRFIGELFAKGDDKNEYLGTWPKPASNTNEFIWHLDDEHSELRKAAEEVAKKYNQQTDRIVRIAHIDTGYRNHITKPQFLNTTLGKSFINGTRADDAEDKLNSGFPAEQDGHGCATMAILAGNKVSEEHTYIPYSGYFGAVPFAEVVPIRICETVYNMFNANDVADAIDYAVDNNCDVITMSMAGYPTKAVAAAVNRAYQKGVVIVTAAGNNWFEGIQKIAPKSVLYPARFQRVIAATGACCDHFPYDSEAPRSGRSRSAGGEVMQGNWGPESAMKYAVAGYTPNLPWASINGKSAFLRSGGGTSSATPQVAATIALWIAYNREKLKEKNLAGTWQQVEAARKAVFSTASKTYPQYKKYFGNGIIRAHKALSAFQFTDEEIAKLQEAKKASVSFTGIIPFIGQWFRSGPDAAAKNNEEDILSEMIATEVLQVVHQDPSLMEYAETFDPQDEEDSFLVDEEARKVFFKKLSESPFASNQLKIIAGQAIGNIQISPGADAELAIPPDTTSPSTTSPKQEPETV